MGRCFVNSQYVNNGYVYTNYYRAGKPVDILAGGDIVNTLRIDSAEQSHGCVDDRREREISSTWGNTIYTYNSVTKGYTAQAGLLVAGPGTLEVTAGGNLYEGATSSIDSIGGLITGDTRPGSNVVLAAGVGPGTPGIGQVNWNGFAQEYLDPANLAAAGPLADQPGKVAESYNDQLYTWLQQMFSYKGTQTDALKYFDALLAISSGSFCGKSITPS